MQEKRKILFVTSELAPLLSTGGLADVANALPKALREQGHDVRIIMPCYRSIDSAHHGDQYCLCVAEMGQGTEYGAMRVSKLPETDIPLYLIEHEKYFGRDHPYGTGAYEYVDNAERFCFFSLAVLHAIPQLDWIPDVLHCHDWHTAPLPTFLRTRYAQHPSWNNTPVLFTIHNLAFQGRYGADKFNDTGLSPELFHPNCLEYEGDMNLMKGAIAFSNKINTVSPRYAREIQTLEYGSGLDGMLRTRSADLSGILNGVDYSLWHPEKDPHIAASYSVKNMQGKKKCKAALQEAFGLPKSDAPLFGVVSRLYWQKGLDLISGAIEQVAKNDMQLVILGTGDPDIEYQLSEAARQYPEKISVKIGFDVPLSHIIQAGSDFFLMPSRYEPCGLTQLYGLAYGAVPIVRRTGGLADTIVDANSVNLKNKSATGLSFVPLSVGSMVRTFDRALALYTNKRLYNQVRRTGMKQAFSWDRSCEGYLRLYEEAIASA